MYDLIVRNGQVVTADGVSPGAVAVVEGKVVAVGPDVYRPAKQEIDASGLHVFPGLIDTHVHFNDPGRSDWEGIPTGSAALAAGGGTCFFDMPLNSSPPVLDGESFDKKVAAATGRSYADFALWGGLTPGNVDKMEELAARGVIGFKAFMSDSGIADFPRADDWTLEQGMRNAAKLGLPVAVHAENQEMVAGKTAWMRKHLPEKAFLDPQAAAMTWSLSRETLTEAEAILRAQFFAFTAKCGLHIVHVSNRFAVEAAAKCRRGTNAGKIDLSIETCPHYFMLNVEDVRKIGVGAKCAPPIRVAPHPDQLWETVVNGLVDMIGSDHSPAPPSMKESDFFSAWGGIAGVQSTLAALLTRQPALPLERVAKLTAATPAKRFRLPAKGQIAAGFDADFSLVNLSAEYELTREMLLDRHKLSPYVGRKFRGAVRRTVLRGETVFLEGKIVGEPRGRLLRPAEKGAGDGAS